METAEFLDGYERLKLELRGRVLLVTLNRPEARNAIDEVLRREIRQLLTSLTGNNAVGAVVLTGEGEAFCAGGDVRMMRSFMAAD